MDRIYTSINVVFIGNMREGRPNNYKQIPINTVIVAIAIIIVIGFFIFIISIMNGFTDDGAFEKGSPWEDTEDGSYPEKMDSDVLRINGEEISWPDKLSDADEVYNYGTDPNNPDTDGDGMEDGWEAFFQKWDPERMKWTIDPLVPDAFENPDGDGFDADHDGEISDEEALFNLREYCGGAEYDFENECFDESDPIFGGLSPFDNATEIAMLGGFHLYDDRYDGLMNCPEYPDYSLRDDYDRYDPYLHYPAKGATSNPSEPDTDGDGLDDAWEWHYGREMKEQFVHCNGTLKIQGSIIMSDLEIKMAGMEDEDHDMSSIELAVRFNWILNPLHKADSDYDVDCYPLFNYGPNNETIWIYRPDGLTSLQEYEYGTSPLLWDTDNDSFYDTMEEKFYDLSDAVEVLPPDYSRFG